MTGCPREASKCACTSIFGQRYGLGARNGHIAAQQDYAMLLLTEGDPQTEQVDEALYWLGTSASAGHGASAMVLGRIYEIGWYNITPDLCLAQIWYEAGEEMGMLRSPEHFDQVKDPNTPRCD